MALKTIPFDAAVVLDTQEAIEVYIEDAFESRDPAVISYALGVVARASNVSQLAEKTGLSRQAIYKALSADGNPEFATILKVLDGLGLELTARTKVAA